MTTFYQDNDSSNIDINIHNIDFYPDLTVDELSQWYRSSSDIDNTVTANQIQQAIYNVNSQMEQWRLASKKNSLADLGDELVFHYKSAVYALAKANLLRMYRDASVTTLGHDRADGNDTIANEYDRKSWGGVQKIIGKPATRVSLL